MKKKMMIDSSCISVVFILKLITSSGDVGEGAVGHRYESVKSGSAESTSENLVPQSADSDYWFIKSLPIHTLSKVVTIYPVMNSIL